MQTSEGNLVQTWHHPAWPFPPPGYSGLRNPSVEKFGAFHTHLGRKYFLFVCFLFIDVYIHVSMFLTIGVDFIYDKPPMIYKGGF